KEKGFQDPGMNSFNHYSFGSIGEWMYSTVGGLQMTSPGWKTFAVYPRPGGGIKWTKTGFDSPHGHIQCNWSTDEHGFFMDVTVPANTTAQILVPTNTSVKMNGQDIRKSNEARFLGENESILAIQVGGGHYQFESTHASN